MTAIASFSTSRRTAAGGFARPPARTGSKQERSDSGRAGDGSGVEPAAVVNRVAQEGFMRALPRRILLVVTAIAGTMLVGVAGYAGWRETGRRKEGGEGSRLRRRASSAAEGCGKRHVRCTPPVGTSSCLSNN